MLEELGQHVVVVLLQVLLVVLLLLEGALLDQVGDPLPLHLGLAPLFLLVFAFVRVAVLPLLAVFVRAGGGVVAVVVFARRWSEVRPF